MLESQVVLNYCLGFFYVTPITLRLEPKGVSTYPEWLHLLHTIPRYKGKQ